MNKAYANIGCLFRELEDKLEVNFVPDPKLVNIQIAACLLKIECHVLHAGVDESVIPKSCGLQW